MTTASVEEALILEALSAVDDLVKAINDLAWAEAAKDEGYMITDEDIDELRQEANKRRAAVDAAVRKLAASR